MVWAPGTQLQGGRYTIQKVLGHGRFGITYLARDKYGDAVVIKTPNDETLNRPDFDRLQQVFVQEAVKLAKCKHPHIVKAEEPFQENGVWCIAMEYIDGVDLASRARTILPEEDALHYIQQIGEALIEVHKNGLLHRDIKPQNIMLRAGKAEAVLIDFGLAREFEHDLTVTRTEEIAEGFAPLELYSRQADRGAYTDIYSLGATLYILLTGELPVSAKERRLSNVRLVPPNEINPQISNNINRSILWALELEATDRPKSIQEWLDSLGGKNQDLRTQPVLQRPNEAFSFSNNAQNNEISFQCVNPKNNTSNSKSSLTPTTRPDPERSFKKWTLVWAAVAAVGAVLAGIGEMAGWISLFKSDSPTAPIESPSKKP